MKCSNCGNEIADGSLFCEYCGAKQEPEAQATQETPVNPSEPSAFAAQGNTAEPSAYAAQGQDFGAQGNAPISSFAQQGMPQDQFQAQSNNMGQQAYSYGSALEPSGFDANPIPGPAAPKKGKGKIIALIIILAVLLIGAGVACYFLFFGKDYKKAAVKATETAINDIKSLNVQNSVNNIKKIPEKTYDAILDVVPEDQRMGMTGKSVKSIVDMYLGTVDASALDKYKADFKEAMSRIDIKVGDAKTIKNTDELIDEFNSRYKKFADQAKDIPGMNEKYSEDEINEVVEGVDEELSELKNSDEYKEAKTYIDKFIKSADNVSIVDVDLTAQGQTITLFDIVFTYDDQTVSLLDCMIAPAALAVQEGYVEKYAGLLGGSGNDYGLDDDYDFGDDDDWDTTEEVTEDTTEVTTETVTEDTSLPVTGDVNDGSMDGTYEFYQMESGGTKVSQEEMEKAGLDYNMSLIVTGENWELDAESYLGVKAYGRFVFNGSDVTWIETASSVSGTKTEHADVSYPGSYDSAENVLVYDASGTKMYFKKK